MSRKLKFYTAASFYRKPEISAIARDIELAGHEVTARWLVTDHEVDFQEDVDALDPAGISTRFAIEDLEDIDRADALIFFSSAEHASKGRGGRHTEFGYALGQNKLIFIVGLRECAFHSLVPNVRVFRDTPKFMWALSDGTIERHVDDWENLWIGGAQRDETTAP
jgi:nucleoside 2-deoxyribosyltransferase